MLKDYYKSQTYSHKTVFQDQTVFHKGFHENFHDTAFYKKFHKGLFHKGFLKFDVKSVFHKSRLGFARKGGLGFIYKDRNVSHKDRIVFHKNGLGFVHKDHLGFGGMVFLLTALISGVTMLYTVRMSWISTTESMADNIAYSVTVNTANSLYTDRFQSLNLVNRTSTVSNSNGTIDPLGQYNSILQSMKLVNRNSQAPTHYTLTWDAKNSKCTLQFPAFQITTGDYIRPHKQASVIESSN